MEKLKNKRAAQSEHLFMPHSPSNYGIYFLLGVGLEYQFLPKLSFYAEPTFTRSVQPVATLDIIDLYAEGKMVNIGLKYQL